MLLGLCLSAIQTPPPSSRRSQTPSVNVFCKGEIPVSDPQVRTCFVISLYVLSFKYLDVRLEGKYF
jgi:hypothetical protein